MSVVRTATLPVPELLLRYPELAGVRFPDTYRNDGVPLLLQDAAAPESPREDVRFPLNLIEEMREHQPRERRSMTASLSRGRQASRLNLGKLAQLRLASRPFLEVTIRVTRVVSIGRQLIVDIITGPDAGKMADVVLGPRWPWDVLAG